MTTVSKSSMVFALLTSLVSLTACSGGGGGGGNGGGTLLAPRPTISVSEITGGMPQQGYLAEDYSNAGDSGGLKATLKNGGLTGHVGRQSLTVVHGNSIDVIAEYGTPDARVLKEFQFAELPQYGEHGPELVVGVSLDNITKNTADFLDIPEYIQRGVESGKVALGDMHNDPRQGTIYFTGTGLGGSEFIALNSGLVDLTYASFGAWGAKSGAVGTLEWNGRSKTFTEDDPFEEIDYVPISGGNSAALKVPAANAAFTGKAIAMATQYRGSTLDKPVQEFFTGDAALRINSAGNGGDLTMSFPDFYNIGFQFTVYNNEFHNDGRMPTVTDNGNTSPLHFPNTIEGASLSGNFYGNPGDSTTSASEASGRFEIGARDNPADDLFILDGSFGVKQ